MTSRALRRALLRAARERRLDPTAMTPLCLALAGLRPEPGLSPQQIIAALRVLARSRSGAQWAAQAAQQLGCSGWRHSEVAERLHTLRQRRWNLLHRERRAPRRWQGVGPWSVVRRLLVSALHAGIALRPRFGLIRRLGSWVSAWDADSGCWWDLALDSRRRGSWRRADPARGRPWPAILQEGARQYRSPTEAVAALGREIEHLRREWPERKA